MGLMFEVAEGGFLDIDVRIEGPDGKIVHQVCVSLLSMTFQTGVHFIKVKCQNLGV